MKHKFELATDHPIFQKLHRVPADYNQVIKSEVDKLLETGIITRNESSLTTSAVSGTECPDATYTKRAQILPTVGFLLSTVHLRILRYCPPLSEMTSDVKDFTWTDDMQVAFEKLK